MLAVVLETILQRHGMDWISSDDFQKICGEIEPATSSKSRGKFGRRLKMLGYLEDEGVRNRRYRLLAKARDLIRTHSSQAIRHDEDVQSIPSAEAIRARMVELNRQVTGYDAVASKHSKLSEKIVEIEAEIARVQGELQTLIAR